MDAHLRAWQPGDTEALVAALRSSPEVADQLGVGGVVGSAEAQRLLHHQLISDGPTAWNFAVVVDGTAVGNVGVSHVEHQHDTGWMHYWVASPHRGRGLASAGLVAVSEFAVTDLGLFRLELGHRVNNPGSCRVAVAAGYPAEGIERSKLRYGDLRFDVETHARLATDPPTGRAALPFG